MATLLEKWNYFDQVIKSREREYIDSLGIKLPEAVYKVWGHGNVTEMKITGIRYNNRKYFSYSKRPTRSAVVEIEKFATKPYDFSFENVFIPYEEQSGSARCTGAFPIKDLDKYLTKQEAEDKAAALRGKYEADQKLVMAGTHTRCERCQKATPNHEIVEATIVNIKMYGYGGKKMKFCSGLCAGHEQMAHEG